MLQCQTFRSMVVILNTLGKISKILLESPGFSKLQRCVNPVCPYFLFAFLFHMTGFMVVLVLSYSFSASRNIKLAMLHFSVGAAINLLFWSVGSCKCTDQVQCCAVQCSYDLACCVLLLSLPWSSVADPVAACCTVADFVLGASSC